MKFCMFHLMPYRDLPGDFEDQYRSICVDVRDGERYGVADGEWILVRSRRGEVEGRAQFTEKMRPGEIFIPFVKLEEHAAHFLTNAALDPNSRIPEYKVCGR